MKITNLVTTNLTYSSNANQMPYSSNILLQVFAAVKASLVVIYIIVVKNIIFTFQKSHHNVLQKKFS